MTVVVTDHHEVPVDAYGQILPPADAVVDPKQDGETYPFHEICGAVVAWKLINGCCMRSLGSRSSEWMELSGVRGHRDGGGCHEAAGREPADRQIWSEKDRFDEEHRSPECL